MSLNDGLENDLIEFLAYIYYRVPWGKMKTSKNPHDIFNHRVRAAARRGTVYEFSSKLCNYFGLQSLPQQALPYLENMRARETEILNILSREHIPYCVRAIARSKILREEIKKSRKIKDKNKGGLFENDN